MFNTGLKNRLFVDITFGTVKNYIAILGFVFICFSASAGDSDKKAKSDKATCSYSGTVLDSENAEALTGATVRLVEVDLEVFADFNGEFTFEAVPVGSYTLEISFVSYNTKVIKNFKITKEAKSQRFLL